ncbi:hypothetical protein NLI96_g12264 [Meripilus lineatus]|uniref:Nucleotidyltransferase family protein n=1 Tax=Meripilus lineatus TaxID=2056292 RepID=A0AAD5UU82_9APHY|nr:hypothetical protein NLI96_g12264 [Physisporinus lineatus]
MQTNTETAAAQLNGARQHPLPLCVTADLGFLINYAVQGDIRPQDLVDALSVHFTRMLQGYVVDPARFREMLDDTDSVISGSFVLRYIEGATEWAEGDLDIYIDRTSVKEVKEVLEAEHYVSETPVQQHWNYGHAAGSIREVIKFKKLGTSRSIDVIVSRNKLSIFPIADFWGTQVMNFMTGSSICIAYPQTLNCVAFLVPRRSTDWKVPFLIGKYQWRGYEFRELNGEELGKVRYFGDKYCLCLPLRQGRVTIARGPLVDTVVWKL